MDAYLNSLPAIEKRLAFPSKQSYTIDRKKIIDLYLSGFRNEKIALTHKKEGIFKPEREQITTSTLPELSLAGIATELL